VDILGLKTKNNPFSKQKKREQKKTKKQEKRENHDSPAKNHEKRKHPPKIKTKINTL